VRNKGVNLKKISALILAAGKGTRMNSDFTKVLHEVAGQPMLAHVIDSCLEAGVSDIIIIAGANMPELKAFASGHYPGKKIRFALQKRQSGTANAVAAGLTAVTGKAKGVLVLSGDVPMITPATIRGLIKEFTVKKCNGIICTSKVKDPCGYGRIIAGRDGVIIRIVEEKSCTLAEKEIEVINSGVYVFDARLLKKYIKQVKRDPVKKEYYLTDVIGIMAKNGIKIRQKDTNRAEIAGINDRVQLMEANKFKNKKNLEKFAKNGITIVDFNTVFISGNVKIGRDTVIKPFTVITGPVTIGPHCIIGPSAHIRPDTKIGSHCKIGNYVEIKKSTLGDHVNVSHLSYVGDTAIGSGTNIGAGTITANYDGVKKNKTKIGKNVSVGSNTVFVAPVSVGDNVTVAAGSVVTDNVPPKSLVIARCRQTVKKNWAKKGAGKK
jgi:bifunctional UDP-N-acetylglucosamine pyrophosphorylase / glucosamine-1-phosphate N-acetyltransferase